MLPLLVTFGETVQALRLSAREKANSFLHFAYNKNNRQFCGKTCKGWGQTLGFFFIFYSFLAAVFAIHLAVFLSATPQPGKDVQPTNFGRYAYPNYPNAKIGLVSVPGSFSFNGDTAHISSSERRAIRDIIDSASVSGVSEHCLNETTTYGYSIGQPCIFIRVVKVLEWSPESINESLSTWSTLPLSCTAENIDGLGVDMSQQPDGLPLNLSNHISANGSSRSYPFRGKHSSYITPVMGLVVDLSSLNTSITAGETSFSITITCSVDLSAIGLDEPPASLSRLYEIPSSVSTSIAVDL